MALFGILIMQKALKNVLNCLHLVQTGNRANRAAFDEKGQRIKILFLFYDRLRFRR